MTASLVSLRPVSETSSTITIGGGSATGWQALSDNVDSTYVTNGLDTLHFSNSGSGLTEFDEIISLSLRYRIIKPGATPPETTQEIVLPSFGAQPWFLLGSAYASIAGYAASPQFSSIGSHKITLDDLNNILVFLNVPSTGRIIGLYLDVTYNAAPVLTTLTPSGTVNVAVQTYTWTYNDTENDAEAEVDFLVFPSSVVTAFSMTPTQPSIFPLALAQATFSAFGTADLTKPSGSALVHGAPGGTSTYFNPNLTLPNGDYRVYVRSGDTAVFGRRSEWISADFTVELPQPRIPSVTVSGPYDARFGRVPLLARSFENLLSPAVAGAEGATADYDLVNATAVLDTNAAHLWSDPVNGAWTSTKSLRLTASSAANMSATIHTSALIGGSERIIAGAQVSSVTSRLAFATVTYYAADGTTVVGTLIDKQVPTAAGGAPTFVHTVSTAPSTAQFVKVTITIVSPANTEQHWIDDWIIAPTKKGSIQDAHLWNGNLVSNTSFESWATSSTADWTLVTNGAGQTVGAITEATVDGAHALQIQKNETTFAPPYAQWPDTAGGQALLPVAAGDVVVVTGYYKVVTSVVGATGSFTIEAVYNDATHDQVSVVPAIINHFEQFVAAFQIPTGKTGVSFRLLPQTVGTTGSKGEVHVDLINICRAGLRTVSAFHALGGGSGTPLGSGHNNTSGGLLAYHLATPPVPFFTWQQGGLFTSVAFVIERSVDAGVTWTPVRNVPARARDLTVAMFDYEAPPNALVMYRATVNTTDPVSAQTVSSMPSAPIVPDPGFENGLWFGLSADPVSSQFQPPNGQLVGALDSTVVGQMESPFGAVPPWAAQLGFRFLVRAINTTGASLTLQFLGVTQDGLGYGDSDDDMTVTIPGSGDDTGWTRVTFGPAFAPSAGAFVQISAVAPTVPDPTQSTLLALDTIEVWEVDADGFAPVVQTPTCLQWLKDPLNPGANLQADIEVTGLSGSGNGNESTSSESQLVMSPSGRPDTIVIADDVVNDEIFATLQFILRNDAEYTAFEALRHAQRTLLVQFPYGDLVGEQRYVRLGAVRSVGRIVSQDQTRGQRRRVTVQAYEVAAP